MASQSNGLVDDDHPDEIGTRYQVDRVLGRGGMATVYRATDKTTHKALALKQLSAKGPGLLALFEREFQALLELSHPRVIEAYDYGVAEAGPYYTMELLDGDDLRKLSPLPWIPGQCSLGVWRDGGRRNCHAVGHPYWTRPCRLWRRGKWSAQRRHHIRRTPPLVMLSRHSKAEWRACSPTRELPSRANAR
jgi:hypothetical protein